MNFNAMQCVYIELHLVPVADDHAHYPGRAKRVCMCYDGLEGVLSAKEHVAPRNGRGELIDSERGDLLETYL